MCSGSDRKVSSTQVIMDNELQKKDSLILLELSATNDLTSFKRLIEEDGYDIDGKARWYGRRIGSKMMGFEERTPLMIASMFGSMDILKYILNTGRVDVNRVRGSDNATPLHCAASGGSHYSHEVIKLLIDSGADVDQVNGDGKRAIDVMISSSFDFSSKLKRKTLDNLLKKVGIDEDPCLTEEDSSPKSSNDENGSGSGSERKEYPVDPSLPDINNGVYGTDEFRMYTFKIKPCSRAYSHDWTECPFVHPGENAKRRDPRKYHYSCVPCPEFRKGACPKGDACEYAHGVFECWLHPAQYRTRLCKDETNCSRRVCFFAHKPEELRPLFASTGSAVPSPRSTPPMTPTGGSSPIGGVGSGWLNHPNLTPPPALQLPGSRLKAALHARDMDYEAEFRRQQLLDELSGLSMSSPSRWNGPSDMGLGLGLGRVGGVRANNLDDMFGLSLDSTLLAQSPTGMQMRANHRYSTGMPSSPVRVQAPFGMEPSGPGSGSPISNAKFASFANRSQSFIERSTPNVDSPRMPPHLSDWGSSDGKVEWGVQGDELNKFRKSASFGVRGVEPEPEPDVSWVQSLVKDVPPPPMNSTKFSFEEQLKQQYYLNNGGSGRVTPWVESVGPASGLMGRLIANQHDIR